MENVIKNIDKYPKIVGISETTTLSVRKINFNDSGTLNILFDVVGHIPNLVQTHQPWGGGL